VVGLLAPVARRNRQEARGELIEIKLPDVHERLVGPSDPAGHRQAQQMIAQDPVRGRRSTANIGD
jgi:hypothetical protein